VKKKRTIEIWSRALFRQARVFAERKQRVAVDSIQFTQFSGISDFSFSALSLLVGSFAP